MKLKTWLVDEFRRATHDADGVVKFVSIAALIGVVVLQILGALPNGTTP